MAIKEDQSLFPVGNVLRDNQNKVEKQLKNRIETLKTEKDVLDMRDSFNINSDFSVEKSEFKKSLLPKLVDLTMLNSTNEQHFRISLSILNIILFNDYEFGKSKLCKSAITANLVQNLDAIEQATKTIEIKQLIIDALLLLSLIVSDGNKEVRKSMKPNTNLMISLTIRILNDSDNETLIKESLILFQYFICQSKNYETISPVLSTLIKLLKHTDRSIISQSLYTILLFSQSFRESRQALIGANVGLKLKDLWTDSEEEELVKPLFSIIKTILPRLNDYKNYFLSSELNILDIIPKLCSSTDLNKIFATEIVAMIAMKPLNAQNYTSTEQINTIVKYNTIKQMTNLLETDPSPDVRSSALDAIYIVAYNSNLDQLKQLVEQGCLKALCTQLETTDEKHLAQTVRSVAVFLLEEFKDILKNEKIITNPKESLTPFAEIVKGTDGFNHLNRLNRERIEKEEKLNAGIPDWKLKSTDYKVGYKATDTEKMIEELMVCCFGIGQHYKTRKPSMAVMAEDKSHISCCDCKNALANTDIFSCGHITYCKKCASGAVHKVYKDLLGSTNPKQCSVEGCTDRIPSSACPLWMFRSRLYKEYIKHQKNLEKEIHPEIIK